MKTELITLLTALSQQGEHGFVPDGGLQWWYLTGHLWEEESTACGSPESQAEFPVEGSQIRPAHYSIQLTFFAGQQPSETSSPQTDNPWGLLGHAAESILMATPPRNAQHHQLLLLPKEDSKISKGSLTLARARETQLDIQLGGWKMRQLSPPHAHETLWSLQFTTSESAYELAIDTRAPIWFHGNQGVTYKGNGESNFYYTIPFFRARGTRTAGGKLTRVCGSLWMDREIGIKSIGEIGWTWFALRTASGQAIMVYALTQDPENKKTLHLHGEIWDQKTGKVETLSDLHIDAQKPHCTATACYPQEHTLHFTLDEGNYTLRVSSYFPEQIISAPVTLFYPEYWEGAVHFEVMNAPKSGALRDLNGIGYVEIAPVPNSEPE